MRTSASFRVLAHRSPPVTFSNRNVSRHYSYLHNASRLASPRFSPAVASVSRRDFSAGSLVTSHPSVRWLTDNESILTPDIPSFYVPVTKGLPVKVVDIPGMGKGMVATRDILPFELIFTEVPVAGSPVPEQLILDENYTYEDSTPPEQVLCNNCFTPLVSFSELVGNSKSEQLENAAAGLSTAARLPIPVPHKKTGCRGSCHAMYCSPGCEMESWNTYHMLLCPGRDFNDRDHPAVAMERGMPGTVLAVRVLTHILLCMLRNDTATAYQHYGGFMRRKESEYSPDRKDSLLQLLGLYNELLMKKETGVQIHFDLVDTLAGLCLINGQSWAPTMAVHEYVLQCAALPDFAYDRVGRMTPTAEHMGSVEVAAEAENLMKQETCAGLFRLQSTINHSCEPNALAFDAYQAIAFCGSSGKESQQRAFTHIGSRVGTSTLHLPGPSPCLAPLPSYAVNQNLTRQELYVISIKKIQAGDQICIPYVDSWAEGVDTDSRRKKLRRYGFICQCPCCMENRRPEPLPVPEGMEHVPNEAEQK